MTNRAQRRAAAKEPGRGLYPVMRNRRGALPKRLPGIGPLLMEDLYSRAALAALPQLRAQRAEVTIQPKEEVSADPNPAE